MIYSSLSILQLLKEKKMPAIIKTTWGKQQHVASKKYLKEML